MATREEVLNAITDCARRLGRVPSKAEFKSHSHLSEYQVTQHFPSWNEAVRAAGIEPNASNVRLADATLLAEWGELVRRLRRIPTVNLYRREGAYSPGVFEKHFGPWSTIPEKFRAFATDKPEWADVLPLLPIVPKVLRSTMPSIPSPGTTSEPPEIPMLSSQSRHAKLGDRPTYGNPMDFRGLRHEPVNEGGVIFLFGMVARELGYSVEAVQADFPDCEAKRQVGPGKWQKVLIEFEFESRNFREHGHPTNGCDVIICWRHNWPDCPPSIEIVELSKVIQTLAVND